MPGSVHTPASQPVRLKNELLFDVLSPEAQMHGFGNVDVAAACDEITRLGMILARRIRRGLDGGARGRMRPERNPRF